MQTYLDCIPCFLKQSLEAARNVSSDPQLHERLLKEILQILPELELNRPPPLVGQLIHRKLRALTGVHDPYRAAKMRFNHLVTSMLPELRAAVSRADDTLLAATKTAVVANAIDLGMYSSLSDEAVRAALFGASEQALWGDWPGFRKALENAKDILYLADNCGEIVADRLLIEQLGAHRITLVTRAIPVLNDVTLDDAFALGLNEIVEVVDNGSDAPGTILEECSLDFRQRFARAALIIAKGQGNFETLSEAAQNIYFLFKAKCPVVAAHVGLPLGAHVVIPQRLTRSSRLGDDSQETTRSASA